MLNDQKDKLSNNPEVSNRTNQFQTQVVIERCIPFSRDRYMFFFKIPESECPDIWVRLPRHKWPKSWSSMEDPVVPLERNLNCHLLAGLLWEKQFEKILLKYGWEKVSNWECLFVHHQ